MTLFSLASAGLRITTFVASHGFATEQYLCWHYQSSSAVPGLWPQMKIQPGKKRKAAAAQFEARLNARSNKSAYTDTPIWVCKRLQDLEVQCGANHLWSLDQAEATTQKPLLNRIEGYHKTVVAKNLGNARLVKNGNSNKALALSPRYLAIKGHWSLSPSFSSRAGWSCLRSSGPCVAQQQQEHQK